MTSAEELRELLDVDELHASNIHELLRLAFARGRSGRWPHQDFMHHPDWQRDGYLIARVAVLACIETEPVFELYVAAHAEGLALRAA